MKLDGWLRLGPGTNQLDFGIGSGAIRPCTYTDPRSMFTMRPLCSAVYAVDPIPSIGLLNGFLFSFSINLLVWFVQ